MLRTLTRAAVVLMLASPIGAAMVEPALAEGGLTAAGGQPLPPEQVFEVTADRAADGAIGLAFAVREGYYLYRDRIVVSADPAGTAPLTVDLPPGMAKDDPNFGRVEIYRDSIEGRLAGGPAGEWLLAVRYQGCADAGLCYPPQTQRFRVGAEGVTPVGTGLVGPLRGAAGAASFTATRSTVQASPLAGVGQDESERVADALLSDSLPITLLAFFGAGLLLALTPCVLPMVPILSGLIAGQSGRPGAASQPADRRRAFALSLAYVLAMAVTYALAGIAAGLSGVLLSSVLQNPWVLSAFALVFVTLALSMFGVFDLQLPAPVQAWATRVSNRVPGGRLSGAAAMGSLSALIVGPCIAPPLAGALLFISRSGDFWLGGIALFVMALGMGVPLLAVGTSAGHLLTRANDWYGRVRVVFGAVLLGVAVWITQPLWLPAWDKLTGHATGAQFETVATLQDLRAALADTGGRPVLLDFTAEWCTTCRELERRTFADVAVVQRLEGWRRLRFDVTASSAADREALAAFGLFGPPAVLLFDAEGREQRALRVLNFQPPETFLATLDNFKTRP
ncbi:MAG: protein-disulfide reductase DsbD [Betaproteobacteria bacterium]|nr:protein-disulfide reductase DsbD [Betaproteobacteria bacterium]